MSGGFAYVLDEDGQFEKRCNLEMVELEGPSAEDAAFVADLLEEHHEHTRSEKAKRLLTKWENTLAKFVKVVPIEYRRVLQELERQRAEKSSPLAAASRRARRADRMRPSAPPASLSTIQSGIPWEKLPASWSLRGSTRVSGPQPSA